MKLAEALQERADLNRLIQQLRQRLSNNAAVQEGEVPSEDPQELLSALDQAIQRLEWLITHINLTNCAATRSEIKILSTVDVRALQKQADSLSKELRLLDNLIQQANWSIELQ